MVKNYNVYLGLILLFFIVVLFYCVFKSSSDLLKVNGRVFLLEGNHMPINYRKKQLFANIDILAVPSKVKAIQGQRTIPIDNINSKQFKSKTNKEGEFAFLLKPGQYTFFIVKDEHAYLNKFDGEGFFKITLLEEDLIDLVLEYDSKILY